MSDEVVSKGPCPHCPSSDAYAIYDDGHGYCFSCNTYDPAREAPINGYATTEQSIDDSYKAPINGYATTRQFVEGSYKAIPARRLSLETCKKYGYAVGHHGSNAVHIAPYYINGQLTAQHIRTANKEFYWLGESKKVELFGQHLWPPGGKRLIITEGEIDCLTIAQAFDLRWPVVSIPSGAQGAVKALQRELEWVNSFEEIVLALDNDAPGLAAMAKCAGLFQPGKVRVFNYPNGVKDANELLVSGASAKDICVAVWNARPYRPDGIITVTEEFWGEVNKPIEVGLSYPWPTLTRLTYGIRPNELIGLGAGTGLGKTEVFKEIAAHLITQHSQNVGLLFLEESPRDTILGIMSKCASKLFHLPNKYTPSEKKAAFDMLLSKVHLWDHFGGTSYDDVKSKLRFMVLGLGCKHVFLDHITALTSADRLNDERKMIDYIMTDLASLVRELQFNLHFISHLNTPEGKPHEEGGRVMLRHLRGSRAIAQWSSFIIGLERDQQAEDPNKRHTSIMRILKDRYTGQATGEVLYLRYNKNTGRLLECANEEDTGF